MTEDWKEKFAPLFPKQRKRSILWAIIFALGMTFLIAPWLPGWEVFHDKLGIENFLRILVCFLFLLCASFMRSIHGLRSEVQELTEAVDTANCALYGKNWKAERDAVTLLIGLLSNPKEDLKIKAAENLKVLTGEDFGMDSERWDLWWKTHRANFRRTPKTGEDKERKKS